MKKQIIIASLAIISLASCNYNKEELARLTSEKDSLTSVAFEKEQTINDFLGSFTEIQSNLSEITHKENAITVNASSNPEMIKTSRESIKSQIQEIKALMDESRNKADELAAKLKKSNIKSGKLEKMLAALNEQLAIKDSELTALNVQIATLNASVETLKTSVTELTVQTEDQNRVITDQTTKMNTAYVAVGTPKELEAKKVVVREGGLLGIGKSTKVEPNVKEESFNKIDITQVSTIPVKGKEVKLVTSHPSDSYKIERENDKVTALVITDAGRFWSSSKYLVVLEN